MIVPQARPYAAGVSTISSTDNLLALRANIHCTMNECIDTCRNSRLFLSQKGKEHKRKGRVKEEGDQEQVKEEDK